MLSYKKRRQYEKEQPQFWRYAGERAEISQAKWFKELINLNDYICLTAIYNEKIIGFIIGQLIESPEVYNPEGPALKIDDFCIEEESNWGIVGKMLINEVKKLEKAKGVVQVLVVCGTADILKSDFLKDQGLTIASN